MGSPISSTIADIYLQYFEETLVKHWMETKEIIYYKQYVDDVLITFNQTTTKEATITAHMNKVFNNLPTQIRSQFGNLRQFKKILKNYLTEHSLYSLDEYHQLTA
jgi:hypothetical protein